VIDSLETDVLLLLRKETIGVAEIFVPHENEALEDPLDNAHSSRLRAGNALYRNVEGDFISHLIVAGGFPVEGQSFCDILILNFHDLVVLRENPNEIVLYL